MTAITESDIRLVAKPLVEDFAAVALGRERDRYESTRLNLEHREVDGVHVKTEVGAIQVLEGQRNAGGDGEGQDVPVAVGAESNVQLERRTAEPEKQGIQMEQALVVKVNLDVAVAEGSHVSPLVEPLTVEGGTR